MGKEIHILPKAVTLYTKAMAIEVTVVMLSWLSGRGSNQFSGY